MASGDLTYEENVTGTLTAGQRTSLVGLVSQLWPGQLADLQQVTFIRNTDNTVSYSLLGTQTKAPGQVPIGCRITGRIP
jgi:hypothetical protein